MKKYSILLVEDDELDVISVQRSLKRLETEYELQVSYNGKDALTMLREQKTAQLPDVILLDLNMPKMNGVEFLSALRKDEKLKHLKVFIMTTSAEGSERQAAEELGISGYMIKPLNYDNNSKRTDSMDGFVQFHLRKILA